MKLILIAEDEYDIASVLELVLTEEGYRVILVPDGREALRMLEHERPALVMLDIMMPSLTGLEVLEKMKADPKYSEIPVILMSAAPTRAKQSQYQWTAFLRKPFDVNEVILLVEKLTRNS